MKTLSSHNRIRELMSMFVAQVEGASVTGMTDINKVAETVLIPLFKEVYGLKNLKNLNTDAANFPAIDLGDEKARVAIQVTSTSDIDKVKETLRKFIDHNLHHKFDRIIIYILTRKQNSYSTAAIAKIIQERVRFDVSSDIHDFRDLLSSISSWQLNRLRRVESILEANFGNGNTLALEEDPDEKHEAFHLNLLEMSFPEELYVAELRSDLGKETRHIEMLRRNSLMEQDFTRRRKRHRFPGPRERVRQYLAAHDRRFSSDWECHGGQILTFHDLNNEDLPLQLVINPETITKVHSKEIYEQSEAQENVFRTLLGRCLQQKLYHMGVQWQQDEGLFFFTGGDDEEERREKWQGKKKNERAVYWRVMDGYKPDKVWYRKHLAFRTNQVLIGGQWYLVIKPDWFFSWDGYKTSHLHAEKVSWLKIQKERNPHVFNHLQFITYMLTYQKPATLFESSNAYQFLSFGKLVRFENAPALNDKEWLRGESHEERQKLSEDEDGAAPDGND
jgi:hypothetical protein